MKRGPGPKRKPMRRRRKKQPLAGDEKRQLVTETRAFKEAARRQRVCAVCGRKADIKGKGPNPWQAHHVITRSYLRRNAYPEWHPDNSLRVCEHPCHEHHTCAHKRIALSCLTDRNIAYAVRLLGEGKAHNYLTRHYTGTDRRVDALLEEEYEVD